MRGQRPSHPWYLQIGQHDVRRLPLMIRMASKPSRAVDFKTGILDELRQRAWRQRIIHSQRNLVVNCGQALLAQVVE